MNVLDIPLDLQLEIFSYLDIPDLVMGVRQTCLAWHTLSFDRQLWRHLKLEKTDFGEKLGDQDFLRLLTSIKDHVESITFGFSLCLTDDAFLHHGVFCPHLKSIDFSLTRVRSPTILELVEKYPGLEELHLNECTYVDVVRTLDGISTLSNLKCISFDDFSVDTANQCTLNNRMEALFVKCKKLERIVFKCELLNDEVLNSMFRNCHRLQHLVLESCTAITVDGFFHLSSKIHLLQNLSLSSILIDDDELRSIMKKCIHLVSLQLHQCIYLTDLGYQYIAENCHKLRCLSVNENLHETGSKLSNHGLTVLAENCPLEKLMLNFSNQVGDAGIMAVAMNCPRLQSISVFCNEGITDAGVMALAESCPLLRDVDLHECAQISSRSINHLLKCCPWLHTLNLDMLPHLTQLVFRLDEDSSSSLCAQSGVSKRNPLRSAESPHSLAKSYIQEVISQSQRVQSTIATTSSSIHSTGERDSENLNCEELQGTGEPSCSCSLCNIGSLHTDLSEATKVLVQAGTNFCRSVHAETSAPVLPGNSEHCDLAASSRSLSTLSQNDIPEVYLGCRNTVIRPLNLPSGLQSEDDAESRKMPLDNVEGQEHLMQSDVLSDLVSDFHSTQAASSHELVSDGLQVPMELASKNITGWSDGDLSEFDPFCNTKECGMLSVRELVNMQNPSQGLNDANSLSAPVLESESLSNGEKQTRSMDLEANSPGICQVIHLEDLMDTPHFCHSHLHTLLLSLCPEIEDKSMVQIALFCPDLQRLSVRGCSKVTDEGIARVVESCRSLRFLDIASALFDRMQLTDCSLKAIAEHCSCLEQLECSGNRLFTLDSLEMVFHKCQSLLYVGLTVGKPMAISFVGLQQVVANIPSRRMSIINAKGIEENGHRGNLFIKFIPAPHKMP